MQLIIVTIALCFAACVQAGNYDRYISELTKRNQDLHDQFLRTQPDAQTFFDDYNSKVNALQAQHYIKDSESPKDFDLDAYWDELNSNLEPRPDRDAEEAGSSWGSLLNELSEAQRREEEPFVNKIWGEQKVSGGSGEYGQVTGPHNAPSKAQVKTDSLPSYCDPPNPCPIGYDPAKLPSPCEHGVADTATYNYNKTMEKMANRECPCDDEHMMCPHGSTKVSQVRSSGKAVSSLNPFLSGTKRDDHEAKKHYLRTVDKRGVHANFQAKVSKKHNPWLDGVGALESVQKKAGPRFETDDDLNM